MVYEAIGPGGREALVMYVDPQEGADDSQCVSDNPNRTIQGINKALDRHKYVTPKIKP
jgi:transcriptional/translational regulatory protein YebC/TACO1